jgi:hypothetical protein
MVPFLFGVPSTLYTGIGSSKYLMSRPWFRAKFWSMNSPPAPLSMSPGVSTVSLSFRTACLIGINRDLFSTRAACTESINNVGDADVDPDLRFKNPPFR